MKMMIKEFHDDPETNDIRAALVTAYGDGEISGEAEFTTNWGGIFEFDVEQLDNGTTDVYYVWILNGYLKGTTDHADDHS
jgi:hypothetical protein